ncbi:hypothetical protein [Pseudomonas citronellolis]|uniref:hypothetical protein n=1 Tax=Pseudomonas citronellolis TaxID=53408 RepID=UPI0023E467BA|nr:hypothetical protein [Pseudomonas citronellolis]MDF3935450.1 hypothetical protein [Pseudomonas citronellolis]
MNRIVYFSKMFQAVPHLAQVQRVLPGTFVSNRRSTLQAVRRLYPDMPLARYSRFLGPLAAGNRELKNADVVVTGSPYRSFLQPYPAKKCTVFHGTYMLLSKEALLHNAHFDLLCVIGPRMQQMIQRFDPEVRVRCEPTGFLPFCEFPEQTSQQRAQALSGLGLDPERKTIIYTPSRRGIGSWTLVAEQLVLTTPAHFNLVLRPHPSQALTSRSQDRASFRRVAALAAQRPRTLLDLTNAPLPVLQSVADLVVSDANSPAEESLFYDVPQLFIETDLLSQDVMRRMAEQESMHPDDTQRLLTLYECGLRQRVSSPIDFAPLLERAIDDAGAFAANRQQYFSWVFGERDRLANQRVAKAIQTHLFK